MYCAHAAGRLNLDPLQPTAHERPQFRARRVPDGSRAKRTLIEPRNAQHTSLPLTGQSSHGVVIRWTCEIDCYAHFNNCNL